MIEARGKRAIAMAKNREKLIAAAVPLFRSNGYEEVNIRDVAKAAKMSTGAIFSQFGSKAALFEAAMGEPPPDVMAFLQEVVDAVSGADLVRITALGAKAEQLRRHLRGHHN